jgi:hypothetical protein
VGGESHKTEEEWIVDGTQLDRNKIMDYEAFAGGGETTQSTGSVYRSADNLQANGMRGDAMRGGKDAAGDVGRECEKKKRKRNWEG